MALKRSLTELRNLLAELYPDNSTALIVADDAGIQRQNIEAEGAPIQTWHSILSEAEKHRFGFLYVLRKFTILLILQIRGGYL